MRETLMPRIHPWQGGPEQLFDGLLCLRGTSSGYISELQGVPKCSTGFWLPDRSLVLNKPLVPDKHENKLYYEMLHRANGKHPSMLSVKYVGFAEPINMLPAGTLLRVSLARWWKPNETNEERCYLQLSGWYL